MGLGSKKTERGAREGGGQVDVHAKFGFTSASFGRRKLVEIRLPLTPQFGHHDSSNIGRFACRP